VPGIGLDLLQIAILKGAYYYPLFTDEKNKALRGQVTSPRSHSGKGEAGFHAIHTLLGNSYF
jgi:hypothetical protein